MIEKNSPIAFVVTNLPELQQFKQLMTEAGFSNITIFDDYNIALQKCMKTQYSLFLSKIDANDFSGLIFLQKLRESSNYGMETHFFLCESISDYVMNILLEYEIQYILTKPYTQERILQKLNYILSSEGIISDFEKKYREARAAYTSGMYDISEQMAKDLESKFGEQEKIHILYGDIKLKTNNLSAAKTAYENAIKINSNSISASIKIAHIYVLDKDYIHAAQLTNDLAKMNPYHLKLLMDAGLSNLEVGNLEKAKEHLQRLNKIDEKDKAASEMLAKVHIKMGNYIEFAKILKYSHDEKEILTLLNNEGVRLAKENLLKEAVKMYSECITQFQEFKEIYKVLYNLALAYIKLGDTDRARKCLEFVLQKNPEYEKARMALQKLQ